MPSASAGAHIIHTGQQYDSYLQLPVVPAEKAIEET